MASLDIGYFTVSLVKGKTAKYMGDDRKAKAIQAKLKKKIKERLESPRGIYCKPW